jgi:hypothetical protein
VLLWGLLREQQQKQKLNFQTKDTKSSRRKKRTTTERGKKKTTEKIRREAYGTQVDERHLKLFVLSFIF